MTSALLAVSAATVAAEIPDLVLPRPPGWIGTTDQWTQGFGIALALLNLLVLFLAWRRLRGRSSLQGMVGTLFVGLGLLPLMVIFFGYARGIAGMETVRACSGCHVMVPHVQNLMDPGSEALAPVHYKNRYIRENQCYTCHSDYGMLGTVSAKLDGVRHVAHYLASSYTLPLKIVRPYSNVRCLGCHGESQKFRRSPGHPPDSLPQLVSGEVPCLSCHGPAHEPKQAKR